MATAGELRYYDSAIESVLEDIDSALILKEEQRNAIKAFVDGKYVFAVLPTGFGKRLIYQVYPIERRGICFPGSFKTRPIHSHSLPESFQTHILTRIMRMTTSGTFQRQALSLLKDQSALKCKCFCLFKLDE